jgi:transcriptional regulator of acetoin/glycerol metabolism
VVTIADIKGAVNGTEIFAFDGGSSKEVLTLCQAEEAAIRTALTASGGRQTAAARLLDIDYSRFKRLLEKHGIFK